MAELTREVRSMVVAKSHLHMDPFDDGKYLPTDIDPRVTAAAAE